MANFPSKWYDFVTAKEIKRIRRDMNDKRLQLVQLIMAFLTSVLTPIYSQFVDRLEIWQSVLIWVAFCIYIAIVLFLPYITSAFKSLLVSNILVENKKALTQFDEEVVYSTLVACEFSEFNTSMMDPALASNVDAFNKIEVEYYVKNAVTILASFASRPSGIFGNKADQISKERFKNITNILDVLKNKHSINIDSALSDSYSALKNVVDKL